MKEGLKGKHYASDKEVKTTVMKLFEEQSAKLYNVGIHFLIRRWNIANERNSDYVEK